jgi:predicted permease
MRFRRRKQFETEMDEELRLHIECHAEDLIRSGISREEARRLARIEFGSLESMKEDCRQAWGFRLLDEFRADIRLALRAMHRNPGFTAIGLLSLALGIGANTAIFGVVDAVLLRLLPVHDPNQLVFVQASGTAGRSGPPYPFFELVRERATSFASMAAFSQSSMELETERGRELARGVWVSGSFYETLGVRPILGRTLTTSDDRRSSGDDSVAPVAVISRSFWMQRFGGDTDTVGQSVRIFKQSVTIIGVMPDETMSLEPGSPVDIAVPMMWSDPSMMRNRSSLWLNIVGRLKPGVAIEGARTEADVLFQGYMAGVQLSAEIRRMVLQRIDLSAAGQGLGGLRNRFLKPLTVLMLLAGLVLLAACVNISSLLLARATARQREFAVRLALGASRARLIRQSLTEAMALVGIGTILAIPLAMWSHQALSAYFADGTSSIILDLSVNGRVMAFTVAVAALSGFTLGIIPALRASGLHPALGIHGGSRGIVGNRTTIRFGRVMVVIQVALSVVLVSGAGLFVRSLKQLESVDLGFRREGILTMEITPEREMFGTTQWLNLQTELLDRVRRIPEVRSAGWTSMSPFSGRDRGAVVEPAGFTPRIETDKHIHLAAITPDYFSTIGLPLLLGRGFDIQDHGTAPKVAILNETAARFYFGDGGAIGKTIRFTNYPSRELIYEVVGIVKDAKHDGIRDTAMRFIYVPIPQSLDRINRLALVVRLDGRPSSAVTSIREQIQRVSSTLLITNVATMEQQVGRTLQQERLIATLSAAFGAVALLLSAIGLYGVVAYSVSRRTSEIGIRMALGASRASMVRMILREGLTLAAVGIATGLPVVWLVAGLAKALLYGVTPFDPLTLATTALLLLAFSILAAVVPAMRASLLDPSSALRTE